MIRINLLPDECKKRTRYPVGWVVAVVFFATVLLFALLSSWLYCSVRIPSLEARHEALTQETRLLLEQSAELEHMEKQTVALEQYIESVETLYGRRVIWSRFLHDAREAFRKINAEQVNQGRGVRLIRVAGHGRLFQLEGEVAADDMNEAEEIAQKVLSGLMGEAPLAVDSEEDDGISGVPPRKLVADGWPRIARVEPVDRDVSVQINGKMNAVKVFAFTIEMLVRLNVE